LLQGLVPEDWRRADVAPIFMKRDCSEASNYRPVSLTPVCSKLVEYIMHSPLMPILKSKTPSQIFSMVFVKTIPAKHS
jgi:hypothetical protein